MNESSDTCHTATPATAATRNALLTHYGPLIQIDATLAEAREVRLADLLGCIAEHTAAALVSDTDALLDVARRLVQQGRIRPVVYRRIIPAPSGVRCSDCQHHRSTDHPHLVDCAHGVEPTNPTRLFWDTDRRGCDEFEQSTERICPEFERTEAVQPEPAATRAGIARTEAQLLEGELLSDDDEVDPRDEHLWRNWFDAEMGYSSAVPVNAPCSCGANMTLIDSPHPPMAAGKPETLRYADGRIEQGRVVSDADIARQRASLRYRCEACGTTVRHGRLVSEEATC